MMDQASLLEDMLGNQSLLEAFAQQISDVNEKVDVTLGELRETQVALYPDLPSTLAGTLPQLTIAYWLRDIEACHP